MNEIDKKDLASRLVFLFRIQDAIQVKNIGTIKDELLANILSSIVFNGIMVLYETRRTDSVDIMSPGKAEGIDEWAEIAEPYFNLLATRINKIQNDYPGALSIGKIQVEIIATMDELADKLIKSENGKTLYVSGGSDDGTETKGDDVSGGSDSESDEESEGNSSHDY
jgi:hypothetical protein